MEMTFPHQATRQNAFDRRHDHNAIVATIVARQADSRTAQAMLIAQHTTATPPEPSDDAVEQRIHYFGSQAVDGEAPCGSFLGLETMPVATSKEPEFVVYQNNSANFKAVGLPNCWTGERANLVGHKASRIK